MRRNRWNDPASPWKHPPWNVERIPTILKLPVVGEGVAVEDRVRSCAMGEGEEELMGCCESRLRVRRGLSKRRFWRVQS